MNKKWLIIVGGALVGILGAGAGVYFLKPELIPGMAKAEDGDEPEKAAKEEEHKEHEPEFGADLDVFVVNLNGSPGRYLRTIVSVGVKDPHEKEKIKEYSGPIRHAVIMYLTERKVDELMDTEGKEALREHLLELINEAIGHEMVSNVYFKEFLIQ